MKKYIIITILLTAFLAISCSKYTYPKDAEISNKTGVLLDTLKGYIPENFTFDGIDHSITWNKEKLSEINNALLTTHEIVLYNYYLNRDIYRIMLKEEGELPLILDVVKQGKKDAWLVSKKITPDTLSVADLDSIQQKQVPLLRSTFDNYSRTWNMAHIQKFDSLYTVTNFFKQPIGETDRNFDNFFLIEVHQSDKYWYIYRPLEDSTFAPLIKFVKSLSRF